MLPMPATFSPAESADPLLFRRPCGADPGQGAGPGADDREPEHEPALMAPELSDEQVNLLYRTALGPQRFAAELRERADQKTMRQHGEEALSATRLGSRTRWLWENPPGLLPDETDWRAVLTVAMPGCYRIDMLTDPGTRPGCIASDGHRAWRVYPDRVAVRRAGPLPDWIGWVIDPAWLLDGFQLAVHGTVTVGGRPGLRIVAVPGSPVRRQGLQPGPIGGGRPDRRHRRCRARDHPAPGLVQPGPPGAAPGADRRHDRHRPGCLHVQPAARNQDHPRRPAGRNRPVTRRTCLAGRRGRAEAGHRDRATLDRLTPLSHATRQRGQRRLRRAHAQATPPRHSKPPDTA